MSAPLASAAAPTELRIGWIMPPFLYELPLDAESDEEAAEELYELARTVLPGSTQDAQLTFAQLLGAQLVELKNDQALYAGLCFLEIEDVVTASTVLVTQFEHGLLETETEERLCGTLQEAYPRDEVFPVVLPCGPAVTRMATAPLRVQDADDGATVNLPRNVVQTYVPLPGTAELLLFELSLFTPEGWDTHSALFAEILRTIDWATDLEMAQTRQPERQQPLVPSAEPETHEVLRREARLLLEAMAVHSTLDEAHSSLPTPVTCGACASQGVLSPCAARSRWSVRDLEEGAVHDALKAATAHLSASRWTFTQERSDEAITLTARRPAVPDTSGATAGIELSVDFRDRTCTVTMTTRCPRGTIVSTPTPFG